jgi:hypothetical protein
VVLSSLTAVLLCCCFQGCCCCFLNRARLCCTLQGHLKSLVAAALLHECFEPVAVPLQSWCPKFEADWWSDPALLLLRDLLLLWKQLEACKGLTQSHGEH